MQQEEYFEMIVEVGRQPYKVVFGADYDDGKSRTPVALDDSPNAWSSFSRLGKSRGWHLPVFDVDHRPEQIATHSYMPSGGLAEKLLTGALPNEVVICMAFPEAEPRWVPSSTEGHFHVYVDYPYQWDVYVDKLRDLATLGIIEWGYVNVSKERGATYVRMPGVAKHPVAICPLCHKRTEMDVRPDTQEWTCTRCGDVVADSVPVYEDENEGKKPNVMTSDYPV